VGYAEDCTMNLLAGMAKGVTRSIRSFPNNNSYSGDVLLFYFICQTVLSIILEIQRKTVVRRGIL
jgi:hypothetical protein